MQAIQEQKLQEKMTAEFTERLKQSERDSFQKLQNWFNEELDKMKKTLQAEKDKEISALGEEVARIRVSKVNNLLGSLKPSLCRLRKTTRLRALSSDMQSWKANR